MGYGLAAIVASLILLVAELAWPTDRPHTLWLLSISASWGAYAMCKIEALERKINAGNRT